MYFIFSHSISDFSNKAIQRTYQLPLVFDNVEVRLGFDYRMKHLSQMSLVVRKPAFCVCKNKDADQLRGNREADQRHCFRYTDSTVPLLPKSEISCL